jgi:hypothetical protein
MEPLNKSFMTATRLMYDLFSGSEAATVTCRFQLSKISKVFLQ